jgi:hypothetical protein
MSDVLNLDPEDLSIGDLEDFEEITGQALTEALKAKPVLDADGNRQFDAKGRPLSEAQLSARVIKALVYLTKRRDNPAFTLDDARHVRISELRFAESDAEGND